MKNKNENEDENEVIFQMEKLITDNNEIKKHKYMFRICLIGPICVGKTSLLCRYSDNLFKENYSATIGVDFRVITLKYKDIIAKVHIWDTAGQERFKSISINYYRSSHGFIYVYDITNKDSLTNLESWINLTNENCSTNVINFLVGNKSDLEKEREVSKDEGIKFAQENNLIFMETSAKNNVNVDKLFQYFTYKLIKYFEENQDQYIAGGEDMESLKNFENMDVKAEDKNNCPC